MDYTTNVRAIISSFYVGTGGLDIGLGHSCLGIRGGKNWEKAFTCHSPTVCSAILNVVDEVIAEGLKEEIDLTIKAKLVEKKYSASEIVDLTQKYHKGIGTGIDEVDNVLISILFDMGWQKKAMVILTIPTAAIPILLAVEVGKSCVCLYTPKVHQM